VDAAGNESARTAPDSATTQSAGGGGTGIPYGLYGINPGDTGFPNYSIWTGSHLTNKSMKGVMSTLRDAAARNPKMAMWFDLTSGDEQVFYTSSADHSFDVQAWKDTLDAHLAPFNSDGTSIYNDSLAPYVTNGTLRGHMLLDDISHFTNRKQSDIEAIAAYSKFRLPVLPTIVRYRPTQLRDDADACASCPGGKKPFTQLDAGWAQYRPTAGDAATYRDTEIQAAKNLHIGTLLGINITAGMKDNSPVPTDSIVKWGSILLAPGSSDYACGFLMWNHQYVGLGSSDFATLATKAKNHVASSCRYH
jgi:hypothetical protein